MSNDIRNIIERLAILEGRITPVDVKHGLNADQKSVKQLPALFKPKDISPTLSKTPYQDHPMDGWLVGEQDEEADKEVVEEAKVDEEKLLDKVKKSLTDYLASIEDKYKDQNLKDKVKSDKDLSDRAVDKELINKQKDVTEDPTQEDPVIQPSTPSVEDPTYSEPTPTIKTVTMEDGRMCEIAGDQASGFEIRYGNRRLPPRFKDLDQAELALEMFKARCRAQNQSADYIDEA